MQIKKQFIGRWFILTLIILSLIGMTGCSTFEKIFGAEENKPPEVEIILENETPKVNSVQTITAVATDPEDDDVEITWSVDGGELSATKGDSVQWTAPSDTQTVNITAIAEDEKGKKTTAVRRVPVGNIPPTISAFTSSAEHVVTGNQITLTCTATDPEGSDLTYQFYEENNLGTITQINTSSNSATWTSPGDITQAEEYKLIVKVTDESHFYSTDTVEVLVYSNNGSFWVIDNVHKTVQKYASNGLKILEASDSFTNPVAVESNTDDLHGCFIADQNDGAVYKIDFEGNTVTSYSGITTVVDLALHHLTQKIWAVSYANNTVTIIDEITGTTEKTIYGFNQPTQIRINQRTSDVWIVEKGNNRLIRIQAADGISALPDTINTNNADIFKNNFNGPSDIYVQDTFAGSSTNTVYIADTYHDQIERLTENGTAYSRGTPVSTLVASPILVGMISLDLVNMVMVLNATGTIELFEENNVQNKYVLDGNYNFVKPHVMHVNPEDGVCWIADNGTNQLVKIKITSTSSYTLQRKIGGFLSIQDIAMQ